MGLSFDYEFSQQTFDEMKQQSDEILDRFNMKINLNF